MIADVALKNVNDNPTPPNFEVIRGVVIRNRSPDLEFIRMAVRD